MTLPKNLEEKRNALAELHHDKTNTRIGHYKKGFNSACNLLLLEIEKMVEALKEISKIKYGLQGYVEENDLQGERDYLAKLAFGYE